MNIFKKNKIKILANIMTVFLFLLMFISFAPYFSLAESGTHADGDSDLTDGNNFGIVNAPNAGVPSSVNSSSGGIRNPLGKDVTDVKVLISKALSFVAEIGAIVCVMFLIYAGFLYVQARGNPEGIKKAHAAIKGTIIGIILVLGAQLIASIFTGTINALKN